MQTIVKSAQFAIVLRKIILVVIPSVLQIIKVINQSRNVSQIKQFQESDFMYFRYQTLQNEEVNLIPLELYLNGKRITDEPIKMLNELLRKQQILKIQRCAQSLWDNFPSGVVSFFSMLIFNQCVRHEYLIIYTQNFVVSAEISSSKDCEVCSFQNQSLQPNSQPQKCNCKKDKGYCFQVMIWETQDQKQQNEIYKNYNKRAFSRVLKEFSVEKNNIAETFSFAKLLCLWTLTISIYQIQLNMQSTQQSIKKFYNLQLRNCKTFARSSFYFLDKDFQKYKIFESIFGLYSDKPGYLFDPLQSGLIKVTEQALELSNNYENSKTQLEKLIEELRQSNI
ncbi:hypothetical protein ABPG74_020688 [Tetrahymena malaccensis]